MVKITGFCTDWSLQSISPCINAGDPGGTYPLTDIAGNPRVLGKSIDIGAYEYQSYHKLIEANKTWDVSYITCGNVPCSWYTMTDKLGNDTLICGKLYSKLYLVPFGASSLGKSYSAIREDTVSKQVYLYSMDEQEETLLYDFSLKKNDTIRINKSGRISTLIVDSITTKMINGISSRTIVFVENDIYDPIWIEGIGSAHGSLYSDFNQGMVDGGNLLNCVHIGDSLLYMNPSLITCNSTNVSVIPVREILPEIQVTQNPLRFVFNELETYNSSLQIYELTGSKIADHQMNGEQELTLNVSIYKSGLYIYIFRSPKVQQRGKFLILNQLNHH